MSFDVMRTAGPSQLLLLAVMICTLHLSELIGRPAEATVVHFLCYAWTSRSSLDLITDNLQGYIAADPYEMGPIYPASRSISSIKAITGQLLLYRRHNR
jgi:hypothetical protein